MWNEVAEGLCVTASKNQSVSICVIDWRILCCVHTCSLELLFTLTELTAFQLLSHSVASCGVSTFLIGTEGVCGLMSCRVLTTRVQETADQSGKTCTGVTDQDSAGMLQMSCWLWPCLATEPGHGDAQVLHG